MAMRKPVDTTKLPGVMKEFGEIVELFMLINLKMLLERPLKLDLNGEGTK